MLSPFDLFSHKKVFKSLFVRSTQHTQTQPLNALTAQTNKLLQTNLHWSSAPLVLQCLLPQHLAETEANRNRGSQLLL